MKRVSPDSVKDVEPPAIFFLQIAWVFCFYPCLLWFVQKTKVWLSRTNSFVKDRGSSAVSTTKDRCPVQFLVVCTNNGTSFWLFGDRNWVGVHSKWMQNASSALRKLCFQGQCDVLGVQFVSLPGLFCDWRADTLKGSFRAKDLIFGQLEVYFLDLQPADKCDDLLLNIVILSSNCYMTYRAVFPNLICLRCLGFLFLSMIKLLVAQWIRWLVFPVQLEITVRHVHKSEVEMLWDIQLVLWAVVLEIIWGSRCSQGSIAANLSIVHQSRGLSWWILVVCATCGFVFGLWTEPSVCVTWEVKVTVQVSVLLVGNKEQNDTFLHTTDFPPFI